MTIKMIPVSSENIQSVGYNSEENILRICFIGNDILYDYDDVPEYIYEGLLNADSKGKFHRKEIMNRYSYKKLVDPH